MLIELEVYSIHLVYLPVNGLIGRAAARSMGDNQGISLCMTKKHLHERQSERRSVLECFHTRVEVSPCYSGSGLSSDMRDELSDSYMKVRRNRATSCEVQ